MKTYTELATEMIATMITKNQLAIPRDKNEKWQDYNHRAIHTVGWAIKEMIKEIKTAQQKSNEEMREGKPKSKLITR